MPVSTFSCLRRLVRGSLLVCYAVLASPAFGAEEALGRNGTSAECPGESQTCEEPAKLDRLDVTARRREEPIQAVPVSVTVLGGRELEERGAEGIADYASAVAGMTFTAGNFGGMKVALRGASLGSGFEESFPSTQLLIGETPVAGYRNLVGLGHGIDPRLIDIERIEVLRGPQGTLFGASSLGGTVRIVPNAPDPNDTSGFVGAKTALLFHGGTGYSLEAMGNLPFGEGDGAVRAVGFVDEVPGWIDNTSLSDADVNARSAQGGRLALRFDVGRLRADFSLIDQRSTTDGQGYDEVADPRYEQTRNVPEPTSDHWSLLNATFDYSGGQVRVVSSTSYFDFRSEWLFDLTELLEPVFGANSTAQRDVDTNQEFTQEVRVESVQGGAVNWLVGGFAQHRDYGLDIDNPSPGFDAANGGTAAAAGYPDNLGVLFSTTTHDQIALFASVTYQVTSELELEVGNRWYRHEESYEEFHGGLLNQPDRFLRQSYDESGDTPRISLSWRPSSTETYYLSRSEGFVPGGSNSQDGESAQCAAALAAAGYSEVPDGYGSQHALSLEAGVKLAWPEQSSTLRAAIYQLTWNQLPEGVSLTCGSTNAFFLVNGKDSVENQGVELEYATFVGDDWSVGARATYQETHFSASGGRVPGVPWFNGSLSITRYLGEHAYARLDHSEVGESAENFASGRTFPAYGYTNLALAMTAGLWEVVARVENVADRYAVVGGHRAFLGEWLTTLPPRSLSLGLRRNF